MDTHILLVEDDFGLGQLMKDILCDHGYKVNVVRTGADAIGFLHKEDPTLMILDYKLPDLNAKQIIHILQNEEKPIPPFIVSTGQGDEKTAVEMLKLGALEYIIKEPGVVIKLPDIIKKTLQFVHNENRLKKAQDALKESEQNLRMERKRIADIIEGTNIGTWEWDFTTGELKVNKQWAGIVGYTLEELEPMNIERWRSLVNIEDQKTGADLLEKHFSGQIDFYDIEVRMCHKNGQWIWVQERGCITRRTHDNLPLIMAGTLQDINLRKEKEELEKEIKTTQEALRFKQNFLAGMSHEIKTPLTGIMGIVDILQTKPQKTPEYIKELKQLSASLNETLKQILDYSQIEWGKIRLQYSFFPIDILFEKALLLVNKIGQNHISIKTEVQNMESQTVFADINRCIQIIETLLLYVLNNTETSKISINANKETSKEFCLSIHYNGQELTQEDLNLIYLPFSQMEKIDTNHYKANILGLSLSNELVKLHKGELIYKKDSKQENIIQIRIPQPSVSSIKKEQKAEEQPRKSYRILLVEDQKTTRRIVKLLLEEMGHRVVTAKNGLEATEVFSPNSFDLILMDIQMPVMDGLTAARHIKNSFENTPPIVAFSANVFDENKEKYKAMGFDDFLNKPLEEENFTKLTQQLLQ